jgi:hypothetical protein
MRLTEGVKEIRGSGHESAVSKHGPLAKKVELDANPGLAIRRSNEQTRPAVGKRWGWSASVAYGREIFSTGPGLEPYEVGREGAAHPCMEGEGSVELRTSYLLLRGEALLLSI